ncbi:MAG: beta-propeller fold lactonase family protein [Alphaproteobacteria bacterium]|jgi:6-phosphogluconolactonase (cycloisomerase 2 family)|nr:beta-propeller fold lactonase family protein [Alphaproteobacteria bacterium]
MPLDLSLTAPLDVGDFSQPVAGADFSADGTLLFGTVSDQVSVFQQSGEGFAIVEANVDGDDDGFGNTVEGLGILGPPMLSPDGEHLYVPSQNESGVIVFDVRSDGRLAFVEAETGGDPFPGNLSLSPDGAFVYADTLDTSFNGSLLIYERDAGTGALTFSADAGLGLTQISDHVMHPDGTFLAAATPQNSSVTIYARDAANGGLTAVAGLFDNTSAPNLAAAQSLAFSPDGAHLYVGSLEDAVTVFAIDDSGAPSLVATYEDGGADAAGNIVAPLMNPTDIEVSPNGDFVLVTNGGDFAGGEALLFERNAADGTLTLVDSETALVGQEAAISPDNETVVVDGRLGSVTGDAPLANTPPMAVDDSATVIAAVNSVTIPVVDNDTDADGDDLLIETLGEPANGDAFLSTPISVTYQPDDGFAGQDSFTYIVTDGNGGSDTATVTVTVEGAAPPPDPDPEPDPDPDPGVGPGPAIAEPLSPNATFLRVADADNGAEGPLVLDLAEIGYTAGDVLRLSTLGDFARSASFSDDADTLVGLFSTTDTLLDGGERARVPGAIDAGEDVESSPTFFGSLETDIPEDFEITGDGVDVAVPAGASYLFVGVLDNLLEDNLDADDDLGLALVPGMPDDDEDDGDDDGDDDNDDDDDTGDVAAFTFDAGDAGWTSFGDATEDEPDVFADGGNPGGHISVEDRVSGDVWYFDAPDSALGDRADLLDGVLTFDLRQSATDTQFDAADIVLVGDGTTLAFDTARNPGTDWTSYTVPLAAGTGWRVGDLDGPAATEAELESVLDELSALRIRGEYRTGADRGDLDNVLLIPKSDPIIDFEEGFTEGDTVTSIVAGGNRVTIAQSTPAGDARPAVIAETGSPHLAYLPGDGGGTDIEPRIGSFVLGDGEHTDIPIGQISLTFDAPVDFLSLDLLDYRDGGAVAGDQATLRTFSDSFVTEVGSDSVTVTDGLPDGNLATLTVHDPAAPIRSAVLEFSGDGDTGTAIDNIQFANADDNGGVGGDLQDQAIDVFRFFNTVAGGHFFTTDEGERDLVQDTLPQYNFEGVGFEALPPDNDVAEAVDVFRFFNTQAGGHFFTTDPAERDFVLNNLPQFQPEGVRFDAFETQLEGTVPVYRFFNTDAGGHFFTTNPDERDLVQNTLPQYDFEGVRFYAFPDDIG